MEDKEIINEMTELAKKVFELANKMAVDKKPGAARLLHEANNRINDAIKWMETPESERDDSISIFQFLSAMGMGH